MATDKELSDFLKSAEKRAFKRTAYAVRDEDAALDIVQDAMIRLAEKYADRPMAELPLIFGRILSNATMDWFRRQKVRQAAVQNFSELESGGEDGDFDLLETLEAVDGSWALAGSGRAPVARADAGDHRRRSVRAAGPSTRSLPAALLGRTGYCGNRAGHGLL